MFKISPAIIKAAAASKRGVFSLMCLLIGGLALSFFNDAPMPARLVVFTLMLAGVAGFGYSILQEQPAGASARPPANAKTFSFPGRWSLQVNLAGRDAASYVDYFPDGTFAGAVEFFEGDKGQRAAMTGKWKYVPVSDDEFRIVFNYDNAPAEEVRFRIFDENRIHNVKMNCLVYRIPV